MIDCRETLKRFYDYLDRELTQVRAREVEEHLDRCRGCFDRFEFEKSFGKFVSTSGQQPVDTGHLKAQIRARLNEMESSGPEAGEDLFPEHTDHAPIDDVPLPELHPAGAGASMGRRIPMWSYVLAAAALVMIIIPVVRQQEETQPAARAIAPLIEIHRTAVRQVTDSDPQRLSDWLAERVEFDAMVREFDMAGCSLSGAAVDSIWAILFAESGGVPVCVMVADMDAYSIPSEFDRVEMNGRTFWTATDGEFSVVVWAWHPTGVVCAAVAEAGTDYLLQLANRVEDVIAGT